MSRSKARSILFLVAHPADDASCRYRVQQFIPHLERAGYECTVSAFSTRTLHHLLRGKGRIAAKFLHTVYCSARRMLRAAALRSFDVVVIHREAFPFFTPAVENWILRRHRNVVFSFDDAIYAGHPDNSALNHPLLYRLKYGRGVDTVIGRSRHVIAGNNVLAAYARQFNSSVTVVPTVVDCCQYRPKSPRALSRDVVTIGWMGSRSTIPYVGHIETALRRIAEMHHKVEFRFFGYPEYKLDVPNLRSLPFRMESEVEDLQSLDIGLMPLPDTEWTRGKCGFKAIQYMAAGVVPVASPVGMTTELIQDSVNGLLATSVDEWVAALDVLLRDEGLRARLATAARRTIEESYSLQVWGPRFVSLIDSLSDAKQIVECPQAAVLNS
ncbi:MAG TPA: glycosyltransferase family 4 protein [Terriglobales bacterium]|nr:glycosyltransferase family 4 protein [Terriglobales bacterium]